MKPAQVPAAREVVMRREITERPISRLLRDGSIIRTTTTTARLWCRSCTPEE